MKFTFTNNEINVILVALSKMPYEQVAQIIEKLLAEIKNQSEENKNA
jgi:hypothetical protein